MTKTMMMMYVLVPLCERVVLNTMDASATLALRMREKRPCGIFLR